MIKIKRRVGLRGSRSLAISVSAIVAVFIAGFLAVKWMDAYKSTAEVIEINVTGRERVTSGTGDSVSSKYLVFTDAETFENTDSVLFGKFNSSDIQGRLVDGRHVVKVVGVRRPAWSQYRNIVEYHGPVEVK